MQKLRDRSTVPPVGEGEFVYVHPETGHRTTARDHYNWIDRAHKHRTANNLPISDNFVEQMEDQLCRTLPPDWCEHDLANRTFVDTRFSLSAVGDAMRVFKEWALQGMPFVSQEEAERRADICSRCYLNVNIVGCGVCTGLASMISGTLANRHTKSDQYLKVCANCKCFNTAQVHIPVDVLSEKSLAVKESFPEFCWQKESGENYQP